MSHITQSHATPFSVGVALDGTGWHPAAWREPGAQPEAVTTAAYWQGLIGEAEAAGFDYVTLDDSRQLRSHDAFERTVPPRPREGVVEARLDALLVASWLAPRTNSIGVIPTVTTTQSEPFHLATALQTLDHLSLGRAGWQLRLSAGAADYAAVGHTPVAPLDLTAIIAGEHDATLAAAIVDAEEVAEVARRLWDSWEDDAIIRDVATGRFLDGARLHHIDFESERFSVVGPSIVPRSPQGQLPITVLAHSAAIFELAARSADVVFITPENSQAAAGASRGKSVEQLIAEVRTAEIVADRDQSGLAPLRIVADVAVAVDSDTELARDRLARLDAAAGTPVASDARVSAGSPEDIAQLIRAWRAAGVDGVRLRPLALPDDLVALGQRVLPLLRTDESNVTAASQPAPRSLRERLGLPLATNRYATRKELVA